MQMVLTPKFPQFWLYCCQLNSIIIGYDCNLADEILGHLSEILGLLKCFKVCFIKKSKECANRMPRFIDLCLSLSLSKYIYIYMVVIMILSLSSLLSSSSNLNLELKPNKLYKVYTLLKSSSFSSLNAQALCLGNT